MFGALFEALHISLQIVPNSEDLEENHDLVESVDETVNDKLMAKVEKMQQQIQCLESRIQHLEGTFSPDCKFMNSKMLPFIPYNEGFDFANITQFTIMRDASVSRLNGKWLFNMVYEPLLSKFIKIQNFQFEGNVDNGLQFERKEYIARYLTNIHEIFVLHENRYLYPSINIICDLMNIDTVKNNLIEKIIFDLDRPNVEEIRKCANQQYWNQYITLCESYNNNQVYLNQPRSQEIIKQHTHLTLHEVYSCVGASQRENVNVVMQFWKNNIDKIYYCKARVPENRFPLESELIKYTDSDFFLPLI